jgi:two-component system response regulator
LSQRAILLVEDDADDQALTTRALAQSRISDPLLVAGDGFEALEILERAEEPPAVVLLDLKLPRLGGFEFLQRLRANERWRLLPVVILTSSGEEQDLVRSYRFGANSYVRKPVDFALFAEAVRQLSAYWLVLNQSAPVH